MRAAIRRAPILEERAAARTLITDMVLPMVGGAREGQARGVVGAGGLARSREWRGTTVWGACALVESYVGDVAPGLGGSWWNSEEQLRAATQREQELAWLPSKQAELGGYELRCRSLAGL
jgi:hypothetical protein